MAGFSCFFWSYGMELLSFNKIMQIQIMDENEMPLTQGGTTVQIMPPSCRSPAMTSRWKEKQMEGKTMSPFSPHTARCTRSGLSQQSGMQ